MCALGGSATWHVSLHQLCTLLGLLSSFILVYQEEATDQRCQMNSPLCKAKRGLHFFRSVSENAGSTVLPHWPRRDGPEAWSFPSVTVKADIVGSVLRPSGH